MRQGGVCAYCKDPLVPWEATADHRVPVRDGGRHRKSNILAACRDCNEAKKATDESAFRRMVHNPPEGCSLSIRLAHFRYRLWTRTRQAQRRIERFAGL